MAVEFAETSETITFCNVVMKKKPGLFTPRILRSMELGRYEIAELRLAELCIEQGDRVLDIGAGLGFLSTKIAQRDDAGEVLSIEANPDLIDVIQSTFTANNVARKARCLHGVLMKEPDRQSVDFFVRKNFWASSLSAGSRAYVNKVSVPVLSASEVFASFRPTMILCDIEGGEIELFEGLDFGSVTRIVVEAHPGIYGNEGMLRLFRSMTDKGFVLDIKVPRAGDVLTFRKAS